MLHLVAINVTAIFAQESMVCKKTNKLEYALIEEKSLYQGIRPKNISESSFIVKIKLNNYDIPIIHYCADANNSKLPFSWVKSEDILFSVLFMHYKNKAPSLIKYRPFETLDTIQLKQSEEQWIKEYTISLSPLNDYNWALTTHRPNYLPDSTREAYINALSFDISVKNDSLTFYLTDKDAFYIWDCKIPPKGERYAEWNQVAVYTSQYFQEDFIPRNESKSYNKQEEIHNAIKDTLLFNGHFKVIAQNNEKYIVNREHAIIYHKGSKEITTIGRVLTTEDYPKIQGKPLFIEDRDQNRLIFFALVEWEDTNLPKPNVYYMKEDEMREYFRYVMD
jgi:hypothetical protein